jgi:hypothetical protein
VKEDAVKTHDNTTIIETGGPPTIFERLTDVAYAALAIETLDYATWMAEAEMAWITVAGR